MNRLTSHFAAASLASAAFLTGGAASADYTITILHFNDMHSRFESISKYDSGCRSKDEAAGKCFAGAARLKTAVNTRRDALKGAGNNVLTLVAGDQFSGTLFFNTFRGQMNAEVLNQIGIDAMTVGNHEFDFGPEPLSKFIDKGEFPLLLANADVSGEPLLKGKVKPYVVFESGGEKVGVIGILTTETPEISSPGDNVKFLNEAETLAATVSELEGQGVNKIIALTHVGWDEDLALAAKVAGVDAFVGGHTNTLPDEYPTMVKGTGGADVPVVSAYAYGKYLGELTLTFDDSGVVTKASGKPWLVDAMVPPDPDLVAYVMAAAAPLEEIKAEVVGSTAAAIEGERAVCRVKVCEMGVLVADAMLNRVKDQGVSIAIQNGGGLRASIDSGDVTMGEVLTVLPFQNTLATFELTGADVIAALENGVSQVEKVGGRFPQVAGLKYTWDPAKEAGGRIASVEVMGAGGAFSAIDNAKTYGVVSNNFMRSGGDGYKVFKTKGMNAYDFGPSLEDVVAEFIKAAGGYKPYTDDRIGTVN